MHTVGSFEAKTNLSRLLDAASKGEETVITKHGRPVAKLISVDWAHQKRVERTFKSVDRLRRAMAL